MLTATEHKRQLQSKGVSDVYSVFCALVAERARAEKVVVVVVMVKVVADDEDTTPACIAYCLADRCGA
jgi:hypothetical protein